MQDRNDGFCALRRGGNAALPVGDEVAEGPGGARGVGVGAYGRRHGGYVEAGGEGARACAGKNDSPDLRVRGEGVEDLTVFVPHGEGEGVEFIGSVDFDMRDCFSGEADAEEFGEGVVGHDNGGYVKW